MHPLDLPAGSSQRLWENNLKSFEVVDNSEICVLPPGKPLETQRKFGESWEV